MQLDSVTLIAILAMAAATYACRAGGVWLTNRVPSSRRVEWALDKVPGSVLVAIVAPAAVQAGLSGLCGLGVTLLAARRTGNLLLALVLGVAVVVAIRHVMP